MSIIIKQSYFKILIILIASLLFFACVRNSFYSQSQKVSSKKWNKNDTLYYTFNTTDSLALYDVYLTVRNTTDYSYQNLFLFITAYYPVYTYSRDTLECTLAQIDGQWIGKGIGKNKDNRFLFKKNARFRNNGIHTIAINQAMRNDDIEGISGIGIEIFKTTD